MFTIRVHRFRSFPRWMKRTRSLSELRLDQTSLKRLLQDIEVQIAWHPDFRVGAAWDWVRIIPDDLYWALLDLDKKELLTQFETRWIDEGAIQSSLNQKNKPVPRSPDSSSGGYSPASYSVEYTGEIFEVRGEWDHHVFCYQFKKSNEWNDWSIPESFKGVVMPPRTKMPPVNPQDLLTCAELAKLKSPAEKLAMAAVWCFQALQHRVDEKAERIYAWDCDARPIAQYYWALEHPTT